MGTSVGITLIAVGAILRFALAGGSPHGLNVHVAGVVLILAPECPFSREPEDA
jgi:hypothetical protein